jgi:tetratricopeptide (TPR) repeat protein
VIPCAPGSDTCAQSSEMSRWERGRRLTQAMRHRLLQYPALLVGVVAALAFIPSLAAGFVVDDLRLIVENPYAQSLSYLPRVLVTHLWDVHGSTTDPNQYYRPLVSASYILNWVVGGGAAWTFHLVNVLAHSVAAALATRIASRWLGSQELGLLAGLVFGLHPTRTESVIWVSGRTDVFMALFLLCGVELAHSANARRGGRWLASAAGVYVCAAGAVLSKELAVVFPVLLAIDWAANSKAQARSYGPLVGVTALMVLVYVSARLALLPVRSSSVLQPWLYAVMTVGAYVERVVWPWPQTLHHRLLAFKDGVPQYPVVPIILAMAAIVGGMAWVVIALRRRDIWVVLTLGALVGTMGPILNFVRTGLPQTTSDRFLYFPMFLFVCLLLRTWNARRPQRRWMLSLCAMAVVPVWLVIDVLRVADFDSQEVFWEHELAVDSDNPYALVSVGDAAAARGNSTRAEMLFRRALEEGSVRFDAEEVRRTQLRLLGLEIDRTADGDVARLEARLRQLLAWCPRGRVAVLQGYCQSARVEHAFVLGTGAVRLGWDSLAVSVLQDVDDDLLARVPSLANLALAHARLGNFSEARRLHLLAVSGGARVRPVDPAIAADLLSRIEKAEEALKHSERVEGIDAAILRATAMAELGAYLRALRVLRPYASGPPELLRPLLVQVLVAARLERDAVEVVGDVEGGLFVVASIRDQLRDRLRTLAPVDDPGWRRSVVQPE